MRVAPLKALYFTQFLSAFADNMIIFIVLAIMRQENYPGFYIGLVQSAFLLAYVVCAPFVGPFADRNAKSYVLLIGNIVKAAGILLLMTGISPVFSYLVVGIGAVTYSPAKYGILPELTDTKDALLRANGKIEGYTIFAILAGSVAGGMLAEYSLFWSMAVCIGLYLISMAGTLAIPRMPGNSSLRYSRALSDFISDVKLFFSNPKCRFSLVGTCSFWMSSTVLRFAFIAWIPLMFGITSLDKISMLVAVTGVGIIIGSLATPYLIPAHKYYRSYLYGLMMALIVIASIFVSNLYLIIAVLMAIGFMGGAFIVPMNTVLQDEGHRISGTGKAVAVQNFVNNTMMLLGMGIYTGATRAEINAPVSIATVGIVLLGFVLYLHFLKKKLPSSEKPLTESTYSS
ncbi:lysophospholipid transporter LplT [Aneurinibacillus migulanus]|uniref:lysophospholipid transporter LplT n=1 Tax=Aneurinibacillus migulanus TaxID=47500 RepID=UPI00209F5527|nr:lysophospholipid transporter LplT [Aneurinibacillus migulanus]MCP1354691.1 lysophospholipid transporter LplT [Aneurinibacillus migulanus]